MSSGRIRNASQRMRGLKAAQSIAQQTRATTKTRNQGPLSDVTNEKLQSRRNIKNNNVSNSKNSKSQDTTKRRRTLSSNLKQRKNTIEIKESPIKSSSSIESPSQSPEPTLQFVGEDTRLSNDTLLKAHIPEVPPTPAAFRQKSQDKDWEFDGIASGKLKSRRRQTDIGVRNNHSTGLPPGSEEHKEIMKYVRSLRKKIFFYEEHLGLSTQNKESLSHQRTPMKNIAMSAVKRRESIESTVACVTKACSVSELQIQILKLQQELKSAKKQQATNSDNGDASEQKQAALQEEIDIANKQLNDVQQQLALAQNDKKRLNDELETMKGSLEITQAELEKKIKLIEECEGTIHRLEDELEKAKCTVQESLNKVAEAENDAQKADERATAAEEKSEYYRNEYHELLKERTTLREQIFDLKGNIRVFCRVRPKLAHEIANTNRKSSKQTQTSKSKRNSTKNQLATDDSSSAVYEFPNATAGDARHLALLDTSRSKSVCGDKLEAQKRNFQFNRVFTPLSDQEDVFAEVKPVVQSVLDGYRVSVFAYGQTGAGKTFTMIGNSKQAQLDGRGLIPRSVEYLLHQVDTMRACGWKATLHVEMLEIYNENIYDLLVDPNDPNSTPLEVKETKSKEIRVMNLSRHKVDTIDQVESFLHAATTRRSTASTLCNDVSSRSHSVFTLHIHLTHEESNTHRFGMLHMIDLAGSERIAKSGASGATLKEAQNINKSLSALVKVIAGLASKAKHISFRDSKLTRLLQSSLSGEDNCKTLMLCNLSPLKEHMQESLCTLRFAESVASCTLKKK